MGVRKWEVGMRKSEINEVGSENAEGGKERRWEVGKVRKKEHSAWGRGHSGKNRRWEGEWVLGFMISTFDILLFCGSL